MRAWLFGLSLIGFTAVAAASCVVAPYEPPAATGSGGSGGTGGAVTSTGTGNQGPGGAGGAGGVMTSSSSSDAASSSSATSSSSSGGGSCTNESDCSNFKVPLCHVPTCDGGVCVKKPITDSNDQKPDAIGDCAKYTCESGTLLIDDQLDDVPIDNNPCTIDSCVAPVDPAPLTCPLLSNGGEGVCVPLNGKPTCVECVPNTACGSGNICTQTGECIPSTCTNSVQDGDEIDKDCGGPCLPCMIANQCKQDTDCYSKNCLNNQCAAPSCDDGKMDGDETGIDCGGPCTAKKCPAKEGCRGNLDCQSGVCYAGICQFPTCADNVKNGGEFGVDCGGTCEHSCGG